MSQPPPFRKGTVTAHTGNRGHPGWASVAYQQGWIGLIPLSVVVLGTAYSVFIADAGAFDTSSYMFRSGALSQSAGFWWDSKNWINVWFVKMIWGWTSAVLILLATGMDRRGKARIAGLTLAGSLVLFIFRALSSSIFDFTAVEYCAIPTEHRSCRKVAGHDISGHSFLLSMCLCVIATALFGSGSKTRGRWMTRITVALASGCIWMLAVTAVGFHTVAEKTSGLMAGICGWVICVAVAECVAAYVG